MCMKQLVYLCRKGKVEVIQYLMEGCHQVPQVPQWQDPKMYWYKEQCGNRKSPSLGQAVWNLLYSIRGPIPGSVNY